MIFQASLNCVRGCDARAGYGGKDSLDAHRFNSQMEKFSTAAKEVHAI